LGKKNRACKQDTADKGELQVKKNPSWYEVKMREVPSGSTSIKGLKNHVPIGLIKPYEMQKPAKTAIKVTIRQERNSRRCSVRA
jgi:hypothetical protein